MSEKWRMLNSGFHTGAENMAVDEALLLQVAAGNSPPVIRFYQWSPPCLSIGHFQSKRDALSLEACKKLGVDYVRRPTGGRAVLHEHEVTYSLIIPEDHPLIPKGVTESYRVLSAGILEGLRSLGVPAEMVPGKKRERHYSAACFDAASWYEIAVDGKKLVGSAQLRTKGVLLQHGSVLLKFDPEKLAFLLTGHLGTDRTGLSKILEKSVTSLDQVLEREVSFDEVVDRLRAGWEKTLGIEGTKSRLSPQEAKLYQYLVIRKYSLEEWNVHGIKPRVEPTVSPG